MKYSIDLTGLCTSYRLDIWDIIAFEYNPEMSPERFVIHNKDLLDELLVDKFWKKIKKKLDLDEMMRRL